MALHGFLDEEDFGVGGFGDEVVEGIARDVEIFHEVADVVADVDAFFIGFRYEPVEDVGTDTDVIDDFLFVLIHRCS